MLGSSEEGFDEDVGGCTISPLREFKAYIQLYGPAKDSISLSLPPKEKTPPCIRRGVGSDVDGLTFVHQLSDDMRLSMLQEAALSILMSSQVILVVRILFETYGTLF